MTKSKDSAADLAANIHPDPLVTDRVAPDHVVAKRPRWWRSSATKRTETSRVAEQCADIVVWVHFFGLAIAIFLTFAWLFNSTPVERALNWLSPLNMSISGDVVDVLVLAVQSWALYRRKRVGLWSVIVLQLLLAPLNLLSEWSIGPTTDADAGYHLYMWMPLVTAAIFVPILWWLRPAFPGRLRHASWGRVLATLGVGLVSMVTIIWLAVFLISDTPHAVVTEGPLILRRSFGWTLATDPQLEFWQQMLVLVGQGLFLLVLLVCLYVFLTPPRDQYSWSSSREVKVRKLLTEHGENDSLGYYATRRDKSAIFSPDGRACVDYAVIGSVALATGDPIGDPGSWPEAIKAWKADARHYGWTLAALGASEPGARAFREAGLSVACIGDEAVLETNRFTTSSTSHTDLRRAVNKLRRAGYSISVDRQGDLSAEELNQVKHLADKWRHGSVERGFSMALGRTGDPADQKVMIVQARDDSGNTVGLLTFAPWGTRGLSLDLMRRAPSAPNGITEFMVVSLMEAADELGIQRVSLNFAMFRRIFATADQFAAPIATNVAAKVLSLFDRFFQLERLYRFSQRFDPVWAPRFLCYDNHLSFAQVAWAAGCAEGFIPLPWRKRVDNDPLLRLKPDQLQYLADFEADIAERASQVSVKRTDQTKTRIAKVEAAAEAGVSLYPLAVEDAQSVADTAALLERPGTKVRFHGRLRHIRRHGGVTFVDVVDGPDTVQVVLERDRLTRGELAKFNQWVSTGDLVVVDGETGQSLAGHRSVLADSWTIAAKSLRPIPFHSFTDPERRLRERSLDLVVNHEGAELLRKRSRAVRAIRDELDRSGMLEVETPILNTIHGGASARPFQTYINAYSADLTLRIAPELYLKRLVVGGMGGIYEIGRNFRNEGADATHNPEFTVVEAYQPFRDYHDMRRLMQSLAQKAAAAIYGSPLAPIPPAPGEDPVMTDISGDWPVKTVIGAVSEALGTEISLDTDFDVLLGFCRKHEVHVRDGMGPGAVIEELYAELVEPNTMFPTFYMDFPVETSPLAGPHRSQPGLAERWDLVARGTEIGTAYSELTDPLEQRERLTEQSLKAAAGDVEAMQIDEDFLAALEIGMPPCGGLGFGVDRFLMLLTDKPIRPVLTFPFVKPAGK